MQRHLRTIHPIKYSIVTPERLNYAVLPFRADQKLMFCENRTCVITSNTGECHITTDEERALTGTWVMDEDLLAVEKGYRILKIFEYKVTRNALRRPVVGYIDMFLKLKSDASAYPDCVRRPAKEERYIEIFGKCEGIQPDRE